MPKQYVAVSGGERWSLCAGWTRTNSSSGRMIPTRNHA